MTNETLLVFKKEAREMLRDKRVRSSALVGPFLLVLMMMVMFGILIGRVSDKSSVKLHVVKPKPGNPLLAQFEKAQANIVTVASLAEGKKLVEDGKAALVLQFPEDFAEKASRGEPSTIDAVFDSKEQRSQIAMAAVQAALTAENKKSVKNLLAQKGIPEVMAAPLQIKEQDVTRNKGASEILVSILPYLIVFWAFVGGMSAASDLVAGEKERNTLETLLISPVARTRIVLGKFLSLGSICLMSSLSGLAAVLVAAYSHLPVTKVLFKDGTGLGPGALGAIILVLIPTVALFASTLIAISTYAKNTREAQTYLSLASIVVAMPALFSQFLGFTDFATARWINLIPILNASAAVRNALIGKLDATSVLMTAGTSAILAVISIVVAVRMFNREQVLLRI